MRKIQSREDKIMLYVMESFSNLQEKGFIQSSTKMEITPDGLEELAIMKTEKFAPTQDEIEWASNIITAEFDIRVLTDEGFKDVP